MAGFKLRDTCCGRREVTDGKFCCKNCPVSYSKIEATEASLADNITTLPEDLGYGEIVYPWTKRTFHLGEIYINDELFIDTLDPYAQARESQEGLY